MSLHIRKVHKTIQNANAGQVQCRPFFVTPCSPRDDCVVSCRTFLPTALCQGWKEKQLAIFLLHRSVQLQCIQQLPTTSQIPMGSDNTRTGVFLESHTRIPRKKEVIEDCTIKHHLVRANVDATSHNFYSMSFILERLQKLCMLSTSLLQFGKD